MRITFTPLLAASLISVSAGLSAQEPFSVTPGQRVRVTAPDLGIDERVATFAALEAGVLTLTADSTVTYPLAALTRFEVYAGRRSHPWRGAGIGFLAGFARGFAAWHIAEGGCYEGASTSACAAVLGGGLGAGTGALLGAFVGGLLWKTDQWEDVPLDGLRLRLAPQRDGLALGVSLAF